METIKKDGLVIEINRHKLQIEKIQQIVNDMLNEGFKIYEVIVIRFINRR